MGEFLKNGNSHVHGWKMYKKIFLDIANTRFICLSMVRNLFDVRIS